MTAPSGPWRAGIFAFLLWTCCSGVDRDNEPAVAEERLPIEWTSTRLVTQDSLLAKAAAAIAAHRPTLASRILAPRVANPQLRTPATMLLAAEAAAAWSGWLEVERLLRDQSWLDSTADGRGRELLARAYLDRSPRERSVDSAAELNARLAIAQARDNHTRGVRLTLRARALDRLGELDESAATYRDAARLLGDVSDWLYLRAASVSPSEGERARLLAEVRSTLARSRRLAAEADGRLRAGDSTIAANTWLLAGDTIAAYRIKLASKRTSEVERAEARGWLTQAVTTQPGTSIARDAAELMLARFAPLSSGEHLAIARSDAFGGATDRALRSFAAAFGMSAGTMQDRYTYATLLARAGRHREAVVQFARVDEPMSLAASAAYQRARSLLRLGNAAEAQRLLRDITTRYSSLPEGSADALYLLGDLASDAGRDTDARTYWRQLAERYPTNAAAQTAAFRAALLAYVSGDFRTASAEWDKLASQSPEGRERNAAQYWSGRALQKLGKLSDAKTRWQAVAAREPRSYYAMLSSKRLGANAWAPTGDEGKSSPRNWLDHPGIPQKFAEMAQTQMARAALLEQLGLDPESTIERDALFRDASAAQAARTAPVAPNEPTGAESSGSMRSDSAAARALAAAYAFSTNGYSSRGILLADRALALGVPFSADDWRLLYPITHRSVIASESKRNNLEPSLVAAIIRQESRYTPTALSPAGARGLMQIMPAVGRALARSRGITPWDDIMLYQPDVNIELGTIHLAAELRRIDADPSYALAAYNAGGSRLARWRKMRGADDPELFVERIPYVETRDYVRVVLRNREFYRSLYALGEQSESK